MVVGVGQMQPKICDQGETGLPRSNIEEGNFLVCLWLPACCLLSFQCLGESRCILTLSAINLMEKNVAASMHQAQYQAQYCLIWSCPLHWAQRKPPPRCGKMTGWGHVCKGYSRPGKRHLLEVLRVKNPAGHLWKRLVRSEGAEEGRQRWRLLSGSRRGVHCRLRTASDGILTVGKTLWQREKRGWERRSQRICLQTWVKEWQKKRRQAARGKAFSPNSCIKERGIQREKKTPACRGGCNTVGGCGCCGRAKLFLAGDKKLNLSPHLA